MSTIGNIALQVISVILKFIIPLMTSIIDIIITFIFTIVHAGCVFVIKNVMGLFMITEKSIFDDKADVVPLMINTYLPNFRSMAISIIALIVAWNLFKTFFEYAGLSSEAEEPWKIGIKIMIFAALVWESKNICRYSIRLFEKLMDVIEIKEFSFTWLDSLKNRFESFDLGAYAGAILQEALLSKVPQLIMFLSLLIIDLKLISVVIDLAEKYIRVGFLIIISPLSMACCVAKSTSQIFTAWVKLFSGTLASVFIKYFLIKILLVNSGTILMNTRYNVLRSAIILIAFTSLIQQSDELIKELGFQAGRTIGRGTGVVSGLIGKGMGLLK